MDGDRTRPRVLMLAGEKTFFHEWTEAARLTADVARFQWKPDLEWEPLDERAKLGVNPSDPDRFEGARSGLPRNRLMRGVGDRVKARRIAELLDHLAGQGRAVDLIHGHFFASCTPLSILHRSLGIPYVVTEHSTKLAGNPYRSVSKAGQKRARRVYVDASSVIAVSDALGRAMVDRNLVGEVEVIPNPIDVELFRRSTSRLQQGSTIRCLNVGRMHPIKGQDVLLEAFALASTEEPRLRLDVIGDGREAEHLDELRRRLQLSDKVRFLGRRDSSRIAQALNHSDLFVLSSRYETFGVPVAEALATGTPVVATAAGAVPELVTNTNGRVVPVDDPEAMANAILGVSARLDEYEPAMIEASAHARFGRSAVAQRLGVIYRKAVAGAA